MIKLSLVGKNIQHSKSQVVYEKILDTKVNYTLLDYSSLEDIPSIKSLLKTYDGISVTAPYKKYFLPPLDINLSPVKSINTIGLQENKIVGCNTDFMACREILKRYFDKDISKFFILGDGAMSELIINILENEKVQYKQFSRKLGNLGLPLKEITCDSDVLFINTCSREYVFDGDVSGQFYFWDLNYNLEHHIQLFKNSPAQYVDGMELLELQAKYALSFWNLKSH